MFDKKGVNCLSLNPYNEKLSMGKEGDNVYVYVCVHEHIVHLEHLYQCITHVFC